MAIITNSAEETQNFAADFAQQFREKGGVIALSGELGAGKTTFTQGFAKGLGIEDKVISPTFVLIRQHMIPSSKKMLYHIDLYRLENLKDISDLGIKEMMEKSENIVLIEWAEKIAKDLPKDTIFIKINRISETQREISVN